eukprot:g1453.t1
MVSSPNDSLGLQVRSLSCWEYGSILLPPPDSCEDGGIGLWEDFLSGDLVPLGELRVVSAWFGDANDPSLCTEITEEVQRQHAEAASQGRRVEIAATARRWGDPATFRLKQMEAQRDLRTPRTGTPFANMPYQPAPGEMVLVPVMQLRFTHDKIRPVFRKGKHRGQPLYELVNDLFRGVVNPTVNLPPLEIYLHKGIWRSLNNRRLWALKAYMGLSGNFQLMVRGTIQGQAMDASDGPLERPERSSRELIVPKSSPVLPPGVMANSLHLEAQVTRTFREPPKELTAAHCEPPPWTPRSPPAPAIPPPPKAPPPQPEDLDLITGRASASVAAQLFAMPTVVDSKMWDEFRTGAGTAPAPAPVPVQAVPTAEPRRSPPVDAPPVAPDVATVPATPPAVKPPSGAAPHGDRVRKDVPKAAPAAARDASRGVAVAEKERDDRLEDRADVVGVLVKNLPSGLQQSDLLQALRQDGFDGQIDYCSLPEVGRQAWLNFRRPHFAQELWRRWHRRRRFRHQELPLQVVASQLQGLEANLRSSSAQALEVRPVPFVALDALQAAQGAPLPTLDLVVW